MINIESLYQEIDTWLETFAPKLYKYSLNGPAPKEDIQVLEKDYKLTLPDDFKSLYYWHNGLTDHGNIGNMFYGMDFFSISDIAEIMSERYFLEVDLKSGGLKYSDPEIDPTDIRNPHWILFGTDHCDVDLFLDLAPSSAGQRGQIIAVDAEYNVGFLVASSTRQLVEDFAQDLKDDLYYLDEDALKNDKNHFLETDDEIDLVNWQDSDRWVREWIVNF